MLVVTPTWRKKFFKIVQVEQRTERGLKNDKRWNKSGKERENLEKKCENVSEGRKKCYTENMRGEQYV